MKTENAPSIQRADYTPLAWTVETVHLDFTLDPASTRVRSRLQCRSTARAGEAGPLLLHGEALRLVSISVDGAPLSEERLRHTEQGLEIDLPGTVACVDIETLIDPSANSTLSGLYASAGGLFTQCEAEGFRRITYFPDRPDVMARYTVRLEGERARYPVLLSNGNLIEQGELEGGRHYAVWEDPFPKPSYLFALVAADLVALERRIKTCSGREVLLQVWVEAHDLDRTEHAMQALVDALRWDEQCFGLELDLDRYMIVAVSDFNMGAMENKGLNIFNAKYVLARPESATDADYEGIESVVAHEYFHNWTGNRVTCRDWFQLTLKEGLTVFRDQQFSADMLARAAGEAAAASARAVKRIEDVRVLRSAQFPEDNGPMAHPIRPDSYQEINNFYTATVYEKGAEVIRMLHTLLGPEGFRNGMDLYFSYHDGCAVTCDDFVDSMAEANGRDLDQFMQWYAQAGTPRVRARGRYDAAAQRYVLELAQHTPPTPGQADTRPLLIPVALGLIGPDGADLPLKLSGEAQATPGTRVLTLNQTEQTFVFEDVPCAPVPSLLRGFSAPVILELDEDARTLGFRMSHDSDAFNRWDAAQRYAERVLADLCADLAGDRPPAVPDDFVQAFARLLEDAALDPAFRTLAASLPTEAYLLDRMRPARPLALRQAMIVLMRTLGESLAGLWLQLHESLAVEGAYRYHPADAGRRALRNLALRYLCAAGVPEGLEQAWQQYQQAGNMTERLGALQALVQSPGEQAGPALADFYTRHADDALVLDKWFALQAGAWRWRDDASAGLERVRDLMADKAFTLSNPNKVYALLGNFFRGNPGEFHREDGAAYAFWAEQVIALDRHNPQVAARMARALENWRVFQPEVQALIRTQLQWVAEQPGLSADVAEIVGKSLNA
ncbi:MAG: aminopeptidase N [Rhodocyclaceae bacterium]